MVSVEAFKGSAHQSHHVNIFSDDILRKLHFRLTMLWFHLPYCVRVCVLATMLR